MNLYDSEFLKIELDDKKKVLKEQWQTYFGIKVENKLLREPMEKILEAFRQEKELTQYISDITERKPLETEDYIWLEENFFPELAKSGLKQFALVSSKDIIDTNYAKNLLRILNKTLEIEVFKLEKNAEAWLASKS